MVLRSTYKQPLKEYIFNYTQDLSATTVAERKEILYSCVHGTKIQSHEVMHNAEAERRYELIAANSYLFF